MRRIATGDGGYSALWVAIVALFLVASAALAVDTSGAFGTAQTDQTTADLSCLAGVHEIPDDPSAGIEVAVAYAVDNWASMSGHTTVHSGTTGTYGDGAGNEIFVDAAFSGDPSKMRVRIVEIEGTYFGKAIGHDSITVVQEAVCYHQEVKNGAGLLPIGALAGSWNGDLFDCAAKITGNCGALSPDSPGANVYRDAVANGIDGEFLKHHGNRNVADPDTGYPAVDCFANPCNVSETEPGNMVGPWHQGLTLRFDDPTAQCLEASWFNCDSLAQVLGAAPIPLGSSGVTPPQLGWHDSLYGTFAAASSATHPNAQHYYFNGDTLNCDSPRLATVPIIAQNLDWDLGSVPGTLPNGRKDVKFIEFYTIYIREPSTIAGIGGPIASDVIWFGPDTECSDGRPFVAVGSTGPVDRGVWLVDS
ncbi:MAG TPA: Tad domain-containing protein [Acidimicrobiia bacterium]|nr:Tad domain-containing protein [Acidimicrobiia bacterium]